MSTDTVAGGVIAKGETQSHTLKIVRPGMTAFWLMYGAGNLNLVLVSPDGAVYDSTAGTGGTEVSWDESPFPLGGILESIMFRDIKPGTWTARVSAIETQEPSGVMGYMVSVLADAVVQLEADVVEKEPGLVVGDRIRVRASLKKEETPIRGATVRATIKDPDDDPSEIALNDDGAGPDSAAGDGLYTAESDPTTMPGEYEILVNSSGQLPGSETPFTQSAYTMTLVALSHKEEDQLHVLEHSRPGPLEPPVEIRWKMERVSAQRVDYVYSISNGSPFPITSVTIGKNTKTSRNALRATPAGWDERKNVPESSYRAPGWRLLYDRDIESLGDMSWVLRDSAAAIASGQSSEFRVALSQPDSSYERSNWYVFAEGSRGGAYEGTLRPATSPLRGDPVQRLGQLHVTTGNPRGGATIQYTTPRPVRPETLLLDSRGRIVRLLPQPDTRATEHRTVWDGTDAAHRRVPAGDYFVQVKYGNTERYARFTMNP